MSGTSRLIFDEMIRTFGNTKEGSYMNIKKLLVLIAMLVVAAVVLTGCGDDPGIDNTDVDDANIDKQWADVAEPDKPCLIFYKDGTVKFDEVTYKSGKFTETDLELTKDDGTVVRMRYFDDGKLRFIYKTLVYERDSELGNDGDTIVNVWKGKGETEGMSFQFTDKGTFSEDSSFYGYYTLNEEEGTIKLAYDSPFTDILLYYKLEDGKLIIEYPWRYSEVSTGTK